MIIDKFHGAIVLGWVFLELFFNSCRARMKLLLEYFSSEFAQLATSKYFGIPIE